MRSFLLSTALLLFSFCGFAQGKKQIPEDEIRTGADRTEAYLPLLKGKKVALVVNQTSEINGVLLPDTLLKLGVDIVKIFSPEHGFRGHADAGAKVKSGVDGQTGLPVVSLYGNNKKPAAEQLKGVDIIVYDLQDVGVRFYTYISTLQYLMEACAENNKPILLLDRPNPLGFIVDGPLMTAANMSFVGMQPIPVVYGMTAAEYAKMLMGEKWLKATDPELTIVECRNYTHASRYNLPVPPSPNLKTMAAIYLYPSLCLFEGTVVSVGRGTDLPFQQFGHPALSKYSYTFTPTARTGATDPPLKNKRCYGLLVASDAEEALKLTDHKLQLKWLLDAYRSYPEQPKFFNAYFKKLAGTDLLQQQIAQGATEEQIRASWKADLDHFRSIRKKYLLYAE
jgi:uncharacterized protein YbbC (DUF1343 family)